MPICLKTMPKLSEMVLMLICGGLRLPLEVLTRAAKAYFSMMPQMARRIRKSKRCDSEKKSDARESSTIMARGGGRRG